MTQDAKPDSLEERLKSHARAFEGLMSIIPAKYYYGEDTSIRSCATHASDHAGLSSRYQEQWKRKKQTKEEARAAKKAKLDPENYKSAKDVLDQKAEAQRKRKREEEGDVSAVEGVDVEKPLGSAVKRAKKTKKQKREGKGDTSALKSSNLDDLKEKGSTQDGERKTRAKAERIKEKKQRSKEKAERKAARAEARKERKARETALKEDATSAGRVNEKDGDADADEKITEMDPVRMDVAIETVQVSLSTASPSPANRSPPFDTPTNHSGSSSISSVPPSTGSDSHSMPTKAQNAQSFAPHIPKPDPAELKNRLQSRIEALRTARKADGPNGMPARNRQELLEARRQKEEARKAHKKELRRKAKEEEARKKAETLARGSPLLSPGSPYAPSSELTNNFSFGRVDFGGGQHASASLSAILEPRGKLKGPSDPGTALLAAQNKQSRLAGLDEEKRADIAEKESWLKAKKRAQGERIRDDTSLLKKTLKRKQKQKKKSEKEWEHRMESVKRGQEMRQKKREANVEKRKEEKGNKGKKRKGGRPKARPGFEGSFRAKAPSSDGARRG
ncbi:MAG: hypothetical protein Q9217_006010 [Psora testacea]